LDGSDSVFGRESPHNQGQIAAGCHPDGGAIDPLHVFRGMITGTHHFDNKLGMFHDLFLFPLDAANRAH
jgi:hypothetical protein